MHQPHQFDPVKSIKIGFPSSFAIALASEKCQELNSNARLYEPSYKIQHDLVASMLSQNDQYWMGIQKSGDSWVYLSTNENVPFTRWQSGQPNNSNGNEDCVGLRRCDLRVDRLAIQALGILLHQRMVGAVLPLRNQCQRSPERIERDGLYHFPPEQIVGRRVVAATGVASAVGTDAVVLFKTGTGRVVVVVVGVIVIVSSDDDEIVCFLRFSSSFRFLSSKNLVRLIDNLACI